jgi:hypothetical protein
MANDRTTQVISTAEFTKVVKAREKVELLQQSCSQNLVLNATIHLDPRMLT